jgi:hypothetical protein
MILSTMILFSDPRRARNPSPFMEDKDRIMKGQNHPGRGSAENAIAKLERTNL